ncbi:MAG: DUF4126 domain-containing protein [Rudaea sp.]
MEAFSQLDTWQLVAIAAALGFASGLRLYAVLFVVGAAGYLGWVELPSGLAVLSHPLVLAASGFMCFVEFFADKIPGVDSLWDIVHTLLRVPAGAALAASVFGDSSAAAMLAAAILGGTLAAGTHAAKTGSRLLINASPEPVSNWIASLSEEALVFGGLYAAFQHPTLFLVLLAVFMVLLGWLLPKLWHALRSVLRRLSGFRARRIRDGAKKYRGEFIDP